MFNRKTGECKIPEDAVKVMERNAWMIFYTPVKGDITIYPTSYHPGALCLTREELLELIEKTK